MLPIHTILFPTDLSERANAVFPLACSLARDCGARVMVLYVALPPCGPEVIEVRHRAEEYWQGTWTALHRLVAPASDVKVDYRIAEGDATDAILDTAADVGAGLICMGTHGRTGPGRFLLGSVAEGVSRRAECPVLTAKAVIPGMVAGEAEAAEAAARSEAALRWMPKTILHPTDFSECSMGTFRLARALARDHGARLIVLHVTTVPDLAYEGYGPPGVPLSQGDYLEDARRSLEGLAAGPGIDCERLLKEGDPASEILRVAKETGADLVVMGTHGRSGLKHLLMGSVAEQVTRKASCPILTLRAASHKGAGGTAGAEAAAAELWHPHA
jgi:nucleotide-binding universal stress UspA family protein